MQRYIRLFTEPPKDGKDWYNLERELEQTLRKNIPRVQQKTGTDEGRRESIYVGDSGTALMEITIAGHRRSLRSSEGTGDRGDVLSPTLLISLADHHLASAFHDGAFYQTDDQIGLGKPKIRDGAHISFLETPVGIATLILSRYPIGRQSLFRRRGWTLCLEYLRKVLGVLLQDDLDFLEDDDGCEILYGRTGFLYALLYLRSTLQKPENLGGREAYYRDPSGGEITSERIDEMLEDLESVKRLCSDENLRMVVQSIIRRGRNGARTYVFDFGGVQPPLMWTWHTKRYLGAAHGVVGILQTLLRCPPSIVEEYFPEMIQTIDWLVTCQDHGGNWPTRAPDLNQTTTDDHDLIQWCHGAPGMIILLSSILRMSVIPGTGVKVTDKQQERFVVSLQRACALLYMRGLLRKGVGLCHGVAGSVYALLAASDLLDESEALSPVSASTSSSRPTSLTTTPNTSLPTPDHYKHKPYFTQACHLALLATSVSSLTKKGEMTSPDHPWSLYEGIAGMCCAWDEILLRLKKKEASRCSGMPGYDDIDIWVEDR